MESIAFSTAWNQVRPLQSTANWGIMAMTSTASEAVTALASFSTLSSLNLRKENRIGNSLLWAIIHSVWKLSRKSLAYIVSKTFSCTFSNTVKCSWPWSSNVWPKGVSLRGRRFQWPHHHEACQQSQALMEGPGRQKKEHSSIFSWALDYDNTVSGTPLRIGSYRRLKGDAEN